MRVTHYYYLHINSHIYFFNLALAYHFSSCVTILTRFGIRVNLVQNLVPENNSGMPYDASDTVTHFITL